MGDVHLKTRLEIILGNHISLLEEKIEDVLSYKLGSDGRFKLKVYQTMRDDATKMIEYLKDKKITAEIVYSESDIKELESLALNMYGGKIGS